MNINESNKEQAKTSPDADAIKYNDEWVKTSKNADAIKYNDLCDIQELSELTA